MPCVDIAASHGKVASSCRNHKRSETGSQLNAADLDAVARLAAELAEGVELPTAGDVLTVDLPAMAEAAVGRLAELVGARLGGPVGSMAIPSDAEGWGMWVAPPTPRAEHPGCLAVVRQLERHAARHEWRQGGTPRMHNFLA